VTTTMPPGRTSTSAPTRPAEPPVAPPAGPAAPPAGGRPVDVRVTALRRFALSITVFNLLGHTVLGFEQARIVPFLAVLTSYAAALAFETLDAWALGRRPEYAGGWGALAVFLLPAHIVGLACGMLLYGNSSPWPYVFAIVVSNASKYVVRIRVKGRRRHVLNPSNTGVALTLALFPWVGAAPPYHFTNNLTGPLDWLLPVVVLTLGTMLNAKLTRKTPLILGWVGGIVAQAVVRAAFFDHSLAGALIPLTGVAFILFTNYMITDPGTTPMRPSRQVVFGATTALIYGGLVLAGVSFGFFFALVATCALRGLTLLAGPRVARLRGRGGAAPARGAGGQEQALSPEAARPSRVPPFPAAGGPD